MNKQCTECAVSAGTHKPAEALHQQIAEPQAEALLLADECEESADHWAIEIETRLKAAKMLRDQHSSIADIEAQHREELRAYEITVANREARIAELEAALVKEAARTASEKRRADQMSQQHDMQAALNRDAREKLASLAATKPAAQGMDAKDAARYRFLRDGDWRENDDVAPFIHLQLNALWDEKIDAALAAQAKQGGA